MNASNQFCPNMTCSARGQLGAGNISIHGRKRPRYKCHTCGQTFSARRGTALEGLRTAEDVVMKVMTLLAYGCPVQAIVHAFGLDERTLADWQKRAGKHCQQVHEAVVQNGKVETHHVQADEIRVKGRKMIAWMGLAIDVSTRLWLAGVVSVQRDKALADGLLQRVRACCRAIQALLICTDGWNAYVRRVGASEIPVKHGGG